MENKMNKVLITGAAGFIGSHLSEYFLKEGFEVIGLDNFLTGVPENITLDKNPNFKFIESDISNNLEIEEDIDLILHFASPASPLDYFNHPLNTIRSNSLGTFNIIDLAEKNNARIVYASTSEVYGDPLINPQREDYWGNVNPVGIRSVYDESKRFSETVLMSYFREKNLDIRIIRIFNTYGPRMKLNDGRVVPNFISQALKDKPLTVYGDGKQTRSFCYVDDLVRGIYDISKKEGINGQVINLGNPEEYPIIEFAKLIIKKTGSDSEIIFTELPEDDPKQRCPDISKAIRMINWKPEISLNEGLNKTILFFRSIISNNF